MKKTIVVAVVCIAFVIGCFIWGTLTTTPGDILTSPRPATGNQPSRADQFVTSFVEFMRKTQVSKQEQDILRKAHPLLLRVADVEFCPQYFWQMVRQAPPEEIAWAKAKELIQSGKVVRLCQTDNSPLELFTRNGRQYRTKQPKKTDRAYEVLREVDPEGVFVLYSIE